MTIDPFQQLRPSQPAPPDPRFVDRLRRRIVAALDRPDLPVINLPERTRAMTDTTTTEADTTTSTAPATLIPYICVSPAAEAIDWYRANLGAVETIRYTGDDGRVGHAELTIGGATIFLSDEYPELEVVSPTTLRGTATTLHLRVPNVDATYELVVAGGGRAAGAPKDEAYGARSFSAVDPFGHRWMIQTPISNPSVEEIQAHITDYAITTPGEPSSTAAPAMSPPDAPVEIGYVTFATPDTAVAARFYGALFGWEAEQGNAGEGYAHIANTRLPMGLTPGGPAESPMLYFRVDDIATATDRVVELGGAVVSRDEYDSGPNAVCRDDQGRQFQLWQPADGYE
ncbi:MAG: VOC family protein [Ilumatobacteraceae bacterium]